MVTLLPVWPVSRPILFLCYPAMMQIQTFHDPTVNLRFTFQPAVITFPNTAQDVSTIMQIAQEFHYSVAARSGGVCLFVI